MITLRNYKQGDISIVRQNPLEEAVKKYPELRPGPLTWTAEKDGKIVAVFGFILMWAGVAEIWFMPTKDALKFKVEAYFCIKKKLDEKIKEHNLRRVQATVRTDYPRAKKMIERLGFKNETPDAMKEFCPDKCDAYLYARLI